MHLEDAEQWFRKAEEDYDAAKILNEAYKKHNEIICYLCSQCVEQYLKGFLIYNDHTIENTHNLPYLNSLCIKCDPIFESIRNECSLLYKFISDIRYPDGLETNGNDVALAFKAIEKIIALDPMKKLSAEINS
jgi:HEPN domain-containing protein